VVGSRSAWVSAAGPRTTGRSAQWADGLLGFDFAFDAGAVGGAFDRCREAWAEAGRDGTPRLASGTWFALGDDEHGGDGRAQMRTYLKRYLNFLEPATDDLIPLATITDGDALAAAADRARTLGADDFVLTPTTASLDELHRAAEILG
jgi:hypothetical protein